MKIIKRNGEEVHFEKDKIIKAITKANETVMDKDKISEMNIQSIADYIEETFEERNVTADVESVQDMVEDELMKLGAFVLAKKYIKYRYDHEKLRQGEEFDERIMTILDGSNEEIMQENANKNPTIASTMRDYMAGEVSKRITRTRLLPPEITEAHDTGAIHVHK